MMLRPKELSDLVTQSPEAVVPSLRSGTTKALRVTKSVSSCRSRRLTYMNKKPHSNTFKHLYKHGEAANQFSECKFPWLLALEYLQRC